MKKAILFLSIIFASGLVMVTVYNTIVDAKSWGSDIPASIQAARDYYKHVDPRRFYVIIGPPNLLLSLLTIILFWKDGVSLRIYFGASFLLYAAIVILTFTYFIPRDLILFTWPIQDHIEEIRTASRQWSQMNWVRTLLGLAGVLCSCKGLDTYYRTKALSGTHTTFGSG
jgi:anthrone oxygenase-like protein